MKIAMIGSKGIPARSGGVERHVEAVATRLAEAGHEVIVYVRPWYTHSNYKLKAKSYKLRSVQLIPLPSITTKHFDAITHTLFASLDVLRRNVDVIHYHGIGPALLLWIPKVFSRATVIATFHCQDYHHQKWNWFARLMLRVGEWMACTMADETVVVSRELERYVWTAYQRHAMYVPNGVEMRNRKLEISAKVKRFGLKPKGYILFVGRLVRHKGVHSLIAAYRKLLVTSYQLPVEAVPPLVIVGASANTTEYEKELRSMARGLPVRFLGEQTGEALSALVKNARLIVHPSVSEGMSLLLLEAMASGRPILSSDIPENREVLQQSATTFAADDINDLHRMLAWCLVHPLTMARRARVARQIVTAYTWQKVSESLIKIYNHAVWIRCANSSELQQKWVH